MTYSTLDRYLNKKTDPTWGFEAFMATKKRNYLYLYSLKGLVLLTKFVIIICNVIVLESIIITYTCSHVHCTHTWTVYKH